MIREGITIYEKVYGQKFESLGHFEEILLMIREGIMIFECVSETKIQ